MAWTNPTTRITGTLITASIWNTDVVDNLTYLKNRPNDTYLVNEGSNYSTTSSSLVAVDSTNLSLSLTSNGGDVLIGFNCSTANSSAAASIFIDIYVDVDGGGYASLSGDDGLMVSVTPTANYVDTNTVTFLHTGLTADSVYTYRVYWKVSSGTATLYAGAGTGQRDVHPYFWIKEV